MEQVFNSNSGGIRLQGGDMYTCMNYRHTRTHNLILKVAVYNKAINSSKNSKLYTPAVQNHTKSAGNGYGKSQTRILPNEDSSEVVCITCTASEPRDAIKLS